MPRSAPPVQKISQRLHVTQDLAARQQLFCRQTSALSAQCIAPEAGAQILFFNGRDGEWLGRINDIGKKQVSIELIEQTRTQDGGSDIWLLVAPVKKTGRLSGAKSHEMGVGRLMPVMTARAQGGKSVKHEKLVANAIEAAEQCEILTVPEISEVTNLADILTDWPQDRTSFFAMKKHSKVWPSWTRLRARNWPCSSGRKALMQPSAPCSMRAPTLPLAGAAHFAHRYGGGGGAGSHSSAAWRLVGMRLAEIKAKSRANLFLAANDPK